MKIYVIFEASNNQFNVREVEVQPNGAFYTNYENKERQESYEIITDGMVQSSVFEIDLFGFTTDYKQIDEMKVKILRKRLSGYQNKCAKIQEIIFDINNEIKRLTR